MHRRQSGGTRVLDGDSVVTLARASRLGLVLLCVVALGTAAASLDSTVATDPDEVISPDWQQLPLSEDDAGDIKEEIQANEPAEQGTTGQAPRPSDGQQAGGASDVGDDATGMGIGPEAALGGIRDSDSDRLDVLLALLRALLPLLLGVLALIGAIGLAYRLRRRLMGLFGLLVSVARWPATSPTRRSSSPPWGDVEPEHAVDRAWLRLVSEVNPDTVRYLTPSECARSAKAAGLPSTPVDAVTTTFEEVRYGGKSVNEDRRRRVREGLRSIGLEDEPG